ncbi:hypothetical protein SAMN05444483_103176 [Salegentibacter echinorum]|uniref:Glycosyltransferase family 52 n=1 Tax=Salegentibacter echinorum TaxID=1073325 RepID=A0A1M5FG82_SALEC|nr:hypothetical protein [Salegentibacter echinorum]SHF90439.1 hypothetical protein SAMN05444483_103176 [Salegentibacter echinorum]
MKILKEKRLFILSNNIHYINAKNYIRTHKEGENHLIFLNKFSKGHQEFIDEIKKDRDFKSIKIIANNQNQKFPKGFLKTISFIKNVRGLKGHFGNNIEKIFISNYLSWQQHYILKQFHTNQIILINDGTAIFKTIELRETSKIINFSHINFLIKSFLGTTKINNLHFYSPIKVPVAQYDSIEIFNFEASKSSQVNSKKVYFIGSPLVELNYLKLNHHLSYLTTIKNIFPDAQITYFAHRGEKDRFLEKYDYFGKVVKDTISFEERLRQEKVLPGYILSYASSILINLPQVYPQINFSYFPLEEDGIPDNSSFKSIYPPLIDNFERMKSSNFDILQVKKT